MGQGEADEERLLGGSLRASVWPLAQIKTGLTHPREITDQERPGDGGGDQGAVIDGLPCHDRLP